MLLVLSCSLPSSPSASKCKNLLCPTPDILSAIRALTSLNLSENELCGIDEDGDGEYDASGVTALADAIGKHQ